MLRIHVEDSNSEGSDGAGHCEPPQLNLSCSQLELFGRSECNRIKGENAQNEFSVCPR